MLVLLPHAACSSYGNPCAPSGSLSRLVERPAFCEHQGVWTGCQLFLKRRSTVRSRPSRLAATMSTDHYSTLGVSRTASKQEIRLAYRKLAKQYHPDKVPGNEEKFKAISAAYEVLSDDAKRESFDKYGDGSFESSPQNPFDLFRSAFFEASDDDELQGDDIRCTVDLELSEAVFGVTKKVTITRQDTCEGCDGTGARSGRQAQCRTCRGRGQVVKTARYGYATVSQVSTCEECRGRGNVILDRCTSCGGQGLLPVTKTLNIPLPAGVESGNIIQVDHEGNAGPRGSPPGHLLISIRVKECSGIKRIGTNLYSTVTVDYVDAILGTEIQVTTLDGKADIRIRPGTQPGDTVTLPKQGAPTVNTPSDRGDHIINVQVAIPRHLSTLERQLVEQLASLRREKGWIRSRTDGRPGIWGTLKSKIGIGGLSSPKNKFSSISLQLAPTPHAVIRSSAIDVSPWLLLLAALVVWSRMQARTRSLS